MSKKQLIHQELAPQVMTHHRIPQQILMLLILVLDLVLAQILALRADLLALLQVAPIQIAIAKVALARALAHRQRVIVCSRVTSALILSSRSRVKVQNCP